MFSLHEIDLGVYSASHHSVGKHRLFLRQDSAGSRSGEISRLGDGEVPHFEAGIRQLKRSLDAAIGTEIGLPRVIYGSEQAQTHLVLGGNPCVPALAG